MKKILAMSMYLKNKVKFICLALDKKISREKTMYVFKNKFLKQVK